MKPYRDYQKDLLQDLQNPKEAAAYLDSALQAGDQKAFLLALRNVASSRGGMSRLAHSSRLHRVSLYRMLSRQGNPELGSLLNLLSQLGLKFCVRAKPVH